MVKSISGIKLEQFKLKLVNSLFFVIQDLKNHESYVRLQRAGDCTEMYLDHIRTKHLVSVVTMFESRLNQLFKEFKLGDI